MLPVEQGFSRRRMGEISVGASLAVGLAVLTGSGVVNAQSFGERAPESQREIEFFSDVLQLQFTKHGLSSLIINQDNGIVNPKDTGITELTDILKGIDGVSVDRLHLDGNIREEFLRFFRVTFGGPRELVGGTLITDDSGSSRIESNDLRARALLNAIEQLNALTGEAGILVSVDPVIPVREFQGQ